MPEQTQAERIKVAEAVWARLRHEDIQTKQKQRKQPLADLLKERQRIRDEWFEETELVRLREIENLTQYVFEKGYEEIYQPESIIAMRNPKGSGKYTPLRGVEVSSLRVTGSTPNHPSDDLVGFLDNNIPKVGEYLVTCSGFIVIKQYVSMRRIKEIVENFNFPKAKEPLQNYKDRLERICCLVIRAGGE